MYQKGSIPHFLQYFWKEASNKIMLAFSGVCFLFMIGFHVVDRYNARGKMAYYSSAKETSIIMLISLTILWTGVLIYSIVKYRNYIKTGR